MKRRMLIFLVIIMMFASMSTYALASTPRMLFINPGLNFEGNVAYCTLSVAGTYATDEIEAVIKLWDGNRCLATWSISAVGYISFNDTHTVTRNKDYTLTADVTINDVAKPRVSTTKECG